MCQALSMTGDSVKEPGVSWPRARPQENWSLPFELLLGIPRSVEACHSLPTDSQDGPERHRRKSANRDKTESVQPSK